MNGEASKKRPKLSETDVESDDEIAAQKTSQLASSQEASSQSVSTASSPKKTKDGELFWDLGAKKRLTLRSWKGRQLVDIREFYGDEPNLLPGKKGISLNMDQFERLLGFLPEIKSQSKN